MLRSGSQSFPFRFQQAVENCVLRFAADVPTFAQVAFTFEAQAFERAQRRLVSRIDVGFDAMKVERIESVVKYRMQRFLHVTLSPKRASQRVAHFSATMREVWLKQSDGPNQTIGCGQSKSPFQQLLVNKS